jgi:hypothetical protein
MYRMYVTLKQPQMEPANQDKDRLCHLPTGIPSPILDLKINRRFTFFPHRRTVVFRSTRSSSIIECSWSQQYYMDSLLFGACFR